MREAKLDRFGIPIKEALDNQQSNVELDKFGIPIKKKNTTAKEVSPKLPSTSEPTNSLGGLPSGQQNTTPTSLPSSNIPTPSVLGNLNLGLAPEQLQQLQKIEKEQGLEALKQGVLSMQISDWAKQPIIDGIDNMILKQESLIKKTEEISTPSYIENTSDNLSISEKFKNKVDEQKHYETVTQPAMVNALEDYDKKTIGSMTTMGEDGVINKVDYSDVYYDYDYWKGMEEELKSKGMHQRDIDAVIQEKKDNVRPFAERDGLNKVVGMLVARDGKTREEVINDYLPKTLIGNIEKTFYDDENTIKYSQTNRKLQELRRELMSMEENNPEYNKLLNEIETTRAQLSKLEKATPNFYDPITGKQITDEKELETLNNNVNTYKGKFGELYTDADSLREALLMYQLEVEKLKMEIYKYGDVGQGEILKKRFEFGTPQQEYDREISNYDRRLWLRNQLLETQGKVKALSDLYLLNESPEKFEKGAKQTWQMFQEGISTSARSMLFGEDGTPLPTGDATVSGRKLPHTLEQQWNFIKEATGELGIELTEEQQKATEATMGELTAQGIGGIIPVALMFSGVVNPVLGRTGLPKMLETLQAGKYSNLVIGGIKLGTGSQKLLGITAGALKEAIVFKTIFGSDGGEGAGYFLGTYFLPNIFKITANTPKIAVMANNMIKSSFSITTGAEGGHVFNAFVNELMDKDDFRDIMNDYYGDADATQQRLILGVVTNWAFGLNAKRPIASKEQLMELKKRNLDRATNELIDNHIKQIDKAKAWDKDPMLDIAKAQEKAEVKAEPNAEVKPTEPKVEVSEVKADIKPTEKEINKEIKAEDITKLREQEKEIIERGKEVRDKIFDKEGNVKPDVEQKDLDLLKKVAEENKLIKEKIAEVEKAEVKPVEKEEGKEIENKAIEEFYETKNPREALYITSEGKFIDGTGKNQVDKSEWQYMKERVVDHREVAETVSEKSGTDALIDYMNKTNNVRMSIQDKSLNIDVVSMPNEKQLSAIKKARKTQGVESIIADISNNKGDVIKSGEFKSVEDYVRFLEKNLPKKEVEKAEVKPVETKTEPKDIIKEKDIADAKVKEEVKKQEAKKKISEGFEELASHIGAIKKVEGQETPDPIKSLIKIAEGTFDVSMVNANRLVNAVKQQAREMYKGNKELLKKAMEFINKNADEVKAIYYANKEPNLPKTEIQKRIDREIESRPQYSQDYRDLKRSYIDSRFKEVFEMGVDGKGEPRDFVKAYDKGKKTGKEIGKKIGKKEGINVGKKEGYKTKQEEFNKFTSDVKKIADNALRNFEISSKDYRKIINQIDRVSARVTKKGFDKAVEKAIKGIDAIIDQNVTKAQDRALEQSLSRADKILKPKTQKSPTGKIKASSKAEPSENIIRSKAFEYSEKKPEEIRELKAEAEAEFLNAPKDSPSSKSLLNKLVALDLAETRANIIDIKSEFNKTKNTLEREALLNELGREVAVLKEWNKGNIKKGQEFYEKQKQLKADRKNDIMAIVSKGRLQTQEAYSKFETALGELKETGNKEQFVERLNDIKNTLEPALALGVNKKSIDRYNKYMETQFKEILNEGLTDANAKKIDKDVKRILRAGKTFTTGSRGGLSSVRKIYTMVGLKHQSYDGLMHILGGNKKNYEKLKELLYEPLLEGYHKEAQIMKDLDNKFENMFNTTLSRNTKRKWNNENIEGVKLVEKETNKSVDDLSKLSFSDVAYLDLALTNERATLKLLGQFTEGSVEVLRKRINDIVKENPDIRKLNEKTREDFFDYTYEINNKTHEEVNRTTLPREVNYFPQKVISVENILEGNMMGKYGNSDNLATLSINASFIHRTRGGGKLDLKYGYDNLISNHIMQTAIYSGKSKSVREVVSLLGDVNIKDAFNKHTKALQVPIVGGSPISKQGSLYKIMTGFLEDYAGVKQTSKLDGVQKINRRIASSILKYNPLVPPKQLVSMTNFVVSYNPGGIKNLPVINEALWIKNNFLSFTKTDADFYSSFLNSPEVTKRLNKGNFDVDYINNTIGEYVKIVTSKLPNSKKIEARIKFAEDLGGLGIKGGDIGAFLLGGKANWKQYVKEYKNTEDYANKVLKGKEKEALKDAYDYANTKLYNEGSKSQQSARELDLTDWQRRSALSKFIPFSTTYTQYGQQFGEASRNILRGEMTYKDVKAIYNYSVLQGLLYSLADGGLRYGYNKLIQAMSGDDDKEVFPEFDNKNIIDLIEDWDDIEEKMSIIMPIATTMINQNQFLSITLIWAVSEMEGTNNFQYAPITTQKVLQEMFEMAPDVVALLKKISEGEKLTQREKHKYARFGALLFDAMTGLGVQTPIKLIMKYFQEDKSKGGRQERGKRQERQERKN